MMLAKGSLLSGQYDKAIARLETINRIEPDNLETIVMLADTYERMNDKASAIKWYEKSLLHVEHNKDLKDEILKRIGDLKK
jgi:tetratricopeptide (TPR) repeat protein